MRLRQPAPGVYRCSDVWKRTSTLSALFASSWAASCIEYYDSCFGAGTPIATPEGDVPIERLRVGDRVLAYDLSSDSVVVSTVSALFVHEARRTGRLSCEENALRVTPNHPVYVAAGPGEAKDTWTAAGHVQKGARLLLLDGRRVQRAAAGGFDEIDSRLETVYNIEVARYHNYFAGGLLVHNKTMPAPPASCSSWHYPTNVPTETECVSGEWVRSQTQYGRAIEITTTPPDLIQNEGNGLGGAAGGNGLPSPSGAAAEISLPTIGANCDSEGKPVTYVLHYLTFGDPYHLQVLGGDDACEPSTPIAERQEEESLAQVRTLALPHFLEFSHVSVRFVTEADQAVHAVLWLRAETD